MWKKAFVALLSVNLLVLVIFTLWWGSLPKAANVQQKVNQLSSQDKTATVQLAVGQDAINAYLEYALTEQKDVGRVLSYARVQFNNDWDIQLGVKLADRVVPCDVVFAPTVESGDLALKVQSATLGQLPVPPSALFFALQRAPWPPWITVDPDNQVLNVLFTKRPQHPYGIHILDYNPDTKLLTLEVTIVPKSLLSH